MKRPSAKIKIKLKKIKIPLTIRMLAIAVLGIILIISAFSTYAAYQEPTTTEEPYTTLTYRHSSRFNYIVYLTNNTVYNKTTLYPGEGIIFKQIVDNLNTSFTYNFQFTYLQIDKSTDISGSYNIQAEIQTDIWTKTYTLVPITSFNSSGKTANFKVDFPIDFPFYDDIVTTINSETGINAPNPLLIIKCNVAVTAKTGNEVIFDSFAPSITVSLNQKTIEISEILSLSQSGSRTGTETVFHQEVVDQRNNWTLFSIIFLIVFLTLLLITTNKIETVSKTEKMLKKINKKYGEWLVKTDKKPETSSSKIITLGTLEDLSKVGEELGKPLIHYNPVLDNDEEHIFYVLDEKTIYKYVLNVDEGIAKTVQCPHCNSITAYNVDTNKEIDATCSKCGNNFRVSFEEDSKLLIKFYSFITGKK